MTHFLATTPGWGWFVLVLVALPIVRHRGIRAGWWQS